ncbi:protein of unknown function (plasmid) [Streptantibioticus cattleyicolor NRRL 8057 = DSM 46488]|nr:protein of unknown function [Streptantibioticus cattleyicolor NRRL 8057 = DSM 46488]
MFHAVITTRYFGAHGHVPLCVALRRPQWRASCSPRWRAARGSRSCTRPPASTAGPTPGL